MLKLLKHQYRKVSHVKPIRLWRVSSAFSCQSRFHESPQTSANMRDHCQDVTLAMDDVLYFAHNMQPCHNCHYCWCLATDKRTVDMGTGNQKLFEKLLVIFWWQMLIIWLWGQNSFQKSQLSRVQLIQTETAKSNASDTCASSPLARFRKYSYKLCMQYREIALVENAKNFS